MRITDATKGQWDKIFEHYKVPITIGNRHHRGPCPICKKKGKFRLYKDWIMTGSYVCVCGAGSGIKLLMNLSQKSFETIASELYKLLNVDEKTTIKKIRRDEIKVLEPLIKFNRMLPLKGTLGETYLKSRGIDILPFKNVRYSESQKFDKYNSYSAMYGMMTTSDHQPVYGHATFLVGSTKLKHDNAKKMYKLKDSYDDCLAVKMFNYDKTLGISEGIETALSSAQMYDLPVWSTLNSNYMKKFVAPKGVEHLIVFADNDANGTGLEAAFTCGRKNILMPNDIKYVDIMWPRERGDFNDILTNDINNDIIQWRLDKK